MTYQTLDLIISIHTAGLIRVAYAARAHCVDMGEVCMDQLSEYYFVCQVTTQILIVHFYCNVKWMNDPAFLCAMRYAAV